MPADMLKYIVMKTFEFMAPCHFGLEAVLKREIEDIGYDALAVNDGHVTFLADASGMAIANLRLRCAERILLVAGRFRATTFEEYFQGMKSIPWEELLTEDARFDVVKATSKKSALFSARDLQSLGKKAIVARMQQTYHIDRFPESGPSMPVRVFIFKDEVTISLDTTGVPLHKRGYRRKVSDAPIAETLAASIIRLSPWKSERILIDPFCGSGTILIEAAQMAAGIAPGAYRSFECESWGHLLPKSEFDELRAEARGEEDRSVAPQLYGFDIDGDMIAIARENAKRAGVSSMIHFEQRPVSELSSKAKFGFIITNPPYGERLSGGQELDEIYRDLGRRFSGLDKWSMFLITSYEKTPELIGRRADKNRKLYNGMIKTYLYQFMGPKPDKRNEAR